MDERDDVASASGFTLSRCYYCRVHHGPKMATEGA